jgi:hypothetical protein
VEETVTVKPRNTLILVAAFAVLFGYVYFVEFPKTPDQLATPTTPLAVVLKLNASDVKTIEVRDLQTPRQVVLTRAGAGWQVQQPENKPADNPTVDDVISKTVSLQATRVLTDVTNVAQFFVTPTLETRLIMSDTTTYAVTVGGKTPDGSDYYVTYTGDKSKVFIVSTSSIDAIKAWLDTPPYEPTATPTFTPTLPPTPTVPTTPTITPTLAINTPTVSPPGIVPTLVPATNTPAP